MADLITTIKVNSSQFDNSIKESTNQIRKFDAQAKKSGGSVSGFDSKISSAAIGGIAKFAGALGVAFTSMEAFDGVIKSTQATSDAFDIKMQQVKSSVDFFFTSIANGDWSNLWSGLDGAIARAERLSIAMDNLGDVVAGYSDKEFKIKAMIEDNNAIIYDPNSSKADKQKALDENKAHIAELSRLVEQRLAPAYREAIQSAFDNSAQLSGSTPADVDTYFTNSLKDNEAYNEYVRRYNELKRLSEETIKVDLPKGGTYQSRTEASYEAEKQLNLYKAQNSELEKQRVIENNIGDDEREKLRVLRLQYNQTQRNISQLEKQNFRYETRVNKGTGTTTVPTPTNTHINTEIKRTDLQKAEDKYKEVIKELTNQLLAGVISVEEYGEDVRDLSRATIKQIAALEGANAYNNQIFKQANQNLTSYDNAQTNYNQSIEERRNATLNAEINNLSNQLNKNRRLLNEGSGVDQKKLIEANEKLTKTIEGLNSGTIRDSLVPTDKKLKGFGRFINWNDKDDLIGYANNLQKVLSDKQMMINLRVNEEALKKELDDVQIRLNEIAGTEYLKEDNISKRTQEFQYMQGALYDLGDSFSYLGGMMGNAEGVALKMIGTMITGITQLLPNIITLTAAKGSEAYASAIASGAGLPFPWNIAAIGAGVAAVGANLASIPKFADGGIVYGNTIAQVGEYAGASNNPEVIAPLSKLRKILAEDSVGGSSSVDFRIAGKDLVGVINNYSSKNKKK